MSDTTIEERLQPDRDDIDRPLAALILDDQEVDRMRLRHLCRKAGLKMEISEAADLAGLRHLLDQGPFDVIFLDYHLGMETGLDALHIVTSHEEQDDAIPIMVTSVGAHDVIVRAMRSGCSDYLIKEELSVDGIRRTISSSLERRILLAAISRERATRLLTTATVERFARGCAPEMQRILTGMLRRLRAMRGTGGDAALADQIVALNGSCDELLELLDTIRTRFDADPRPISGMPFAGPRPNQA